MIIYRVWDTLTKDYVNNEFDTIMKPNGDLLISADHIGFTMLKKRRIAYLEWVVVGYDADFKDRFKIEYGFIRDGKRYYHGDVVVALIGGGASWNGNGNCEPDFFEPDGFWGSLIFENGEFKAKCFKLNTQDGYKFAKDGGVTNVSFSELFEVDVIGNIHTNPELLEGIE